MARLMDVLRATLDRLVAAGKIGPKPIKVSAGRIAWRLATVERWLAESERAGELIDRKTWLSLTNGGNKIPSAS